jgi:hypothetical protein
MNTTKTLKSLAPAAAPSAHPAEAVDSASPVSHSAAVTPTDSRPLANAAYRPRSWRYPMGLFQALLPLDDGPASASELRLGETGYGARYGNRRAWARRFPDLGSTTAADPACGTCKA